MAFRPLVARLTQKHDPDDQCVRHCYSCGVDQNVTRAWEWCFECGHGFRTQKKLRDAYLAEAPYGRWSWRWWRIRFASPSKLDKIISFCPLCLHTF